MTLYLGRTAVNATLAVGGGNVDDVQVDGVSVVTNKVAEIDLTGKQDVISDLSTIRSGATAGATAVQPGDLATVATSGSYNDLDDKPTIPAAQVNSDWNSSSGVSQILNKPILGTMAAENTTSYYTKTELDGKLNSAMHFKGTKARVADLPSSGNEVGDMWNVQSTGANYAWDGSSWDKLSENIDLSGLQPNLTSSNAGTGISITGSGSNVVISNTQTSAEWGNITGTLSNQTDLQTALDNAGTPDNSTISKNQSNQLQAIGVINKNSANGATNPKYDWIGTLAEYNAQTVATSHPDWICYITDDVTGGTSVYTKSEVNTLLNDKQDTLTAGTGIDITNGVISNTQTSAEWGNVTGTLSNQSDLQNALDAKANDSDVVKLTGNQTIGGSKTFSQPIRSNTQGASIYLTRKSSSDTSGITFADLQFLDTQSNRKGGLRNILENGNTTCIYVTNEAGNSIKGNIAINYNENTDSVTTNAPTPATSDNSTQIATTANVDAKITAQAVKLTGNQTIAGVKTFSNPMLMTNSGDVNYLSIINTSMDRTITPSSNYFSHLVFFDKNNKDLAQVYVRDTTIGRELRLHTVGKDGNAKGYLVVGCDSNDVPYTSTNTPATADNSTKIATTAFVKNQGYVGTANLATCHVVTETYVNGTSWYRVWSDGWIEQGGIYTGTGTNNPAVSLLKTMANTNYYANCVNVNYSSTNNYMGHAIKSKQTNTLTLEASYNTSMNIMWIVCGMGA